MRLNRIKVDSKDLSGNLKVIVLPKPASQEEENKISNLYYLLRRKCGGAKTSILSEDEKAGLDETRTLVFTHDSYTHLVPYYCDWEP